MRVLLFFGLVILSLTVLGVLCIVLLCIGHHQGVLGGRLMFLLLPYFGKQELNLKLLIKGEVHTFSTHICHTHTSGSVCQTAGTIF